MNREQAGWVSTTRLTSFSAAIPASCTTPAAIQMQRCARMTQAGAHHAASCHNAFTTAWTSTTARRSPRAAASSQLSPASSQHKHPGTRVNFADPTPVNGLPRSERPRNPLPEHTHASKIHARSKPQKKGSTEQMEAHLFCNFVLRCDEQRCDGRCDVSLKPFLLPV